MDETKNIKQEVQARYGAIVDQYHQAGGSAPIDMDGCAPQSQETDPPKDLTIAERLYARGIFTIY